MSACSFLADADLRDVPLPANTPFRLVGLALGQGQSSQLEVLAVSADGPPQTPRLRSLWKERNKGRAAPLLVVVLFGDSAVLCGPTAAGEDPPVHPAVERGQAERLCREALEQPDRHAAHRFLRDALPAIMDSRMPGVRNEGLLASHEMAHGARQLDAWPDAGKRAMPLLARREETLLKGLGFKIEPCDSSTSILSAGPNGKKLAVAVLLRPDESPEMEADRFSGLSPVSYALTVADRENLPYLVVSQATKLRLYPVRLNVGVGRRGRAETYVEVHPSHLRTDGAAYLWLLVSAEALAEGGTLELLLAESRRFAGALAVRLRERIYDHVVPLLAQGLADARNLKKPTARDLAETYQMAITVLFRLLFIAYAEDKDLLPYRFNGLYQKRSLKNMARELADKYPNNLPIESPFGPGDSRWKEVGLLFRAVEVGNH